MKKNFYSYGLFTVELLQALPYFCFMYYCYEVITNLVRFPVGRITFWFLILNSLLLQLSVDSINHKICKCFYNAKIFRNKLAQKALLDKITSTRLTYSTKKPLIKCFGFIGKNAMISRF